MLIGLDLADLNNINGLEDQEFNDDENEEESMEDQFQKRESFIPSSARLDRFFNAYFSPIIQRRSPRGINNKRKGWRQAFHRTGGTILLGKRGERGEYF
uniref:Uncharacterized protein n=1 Tax=Meloidogyne hapla TaxID=6305 RepID=A0A1I8AYW7_MELHA